ncbi:baculoviral IAP repeat-containing protein 7-A-like [Mercenaria mercenaria]|uniref:baculoviral IAP repeat-containing protein 7-A-like n=1 Tax=Mercenaria mercenaria TaxID=6596 RepID=UPI00234E8AC1|nr:baculoviral IAP repeat-containing protein 7-A-like [Mercenaria mercenaria]
MRGHSRVAFCADLRPCDAEDILNLILKPAHKNTNESTLYNISQNRLLVCSSPFSVKLGNSILQNNFELCNDSSILQQRLKEKRKITVFRMGRKAVLMAKAEEIAMAESKVKRNIISKQWKLRRVESTSLVKLLQNGIPSGEEVNVWETFDRGARSVKHVKSRAVQAEKCYQQGLEFVAAPNEKQNYKNPSHPQQNNKDKYPIQATDVDTDCPSMQMAISSQSMFSRHGETSLPSGFSYQTGNASSSTVHATTFAQNSQSSSQSRDLNAFNQTVPRYADYMTYEKRLSSFQTTKWNINEKPNRGTLVGLGFFYTGREDLVRCYVCGIGLKDWVKNDDVLKEHVKHSPKCTYLLQKFGKHEVDSIQTEISAGTSSGSQLPYKIRSPQYQTMEARLASFRSFPSNIGIPHQLLAVAGLYFTGQGDLCRCFTCDGGLKDWSGGDDPCKEHATYFPNCEYINQLKGREYVRAMQQRRHSSQPAGAAGATSQTTKEPEISTILSMEKLNISSSEPSKSMVSQVTRMGYSERDVETAKAELEKTGEMNPNVENIVNKILDMQGQVTNTTAAADNDPEDLQAITEENERLSQMIQCMLCIDEEPDILILPCAHHRICHKCSENMTHCPVCNNIIEDKIRTYRA